MSKNLLKELIRECLKEASVYSKKVDEEVPVDGYGQVLFAPNRTDAVKYENDEDDEIDLFNALYDHYDSNDSDKLDRLYGNILALIKMGKFEKLLKPPQITEVYRYLNMYSGDSPYQFIKTTFPSIKYKDASIENEIKVIKRRGILKPANYDNDIQSWTLVPSTKTFEKTMAFEEIKSGRTACVVVASTSDKGNKFFINPKMTQLVDEFSSYAHEKEIMSAGPVKITGMAYYYNALSETVDEYEVMRMLLRKISKV